MVCLTQTTERGTLTSLADDWDRLAASTPGASVFLSHTWHQTWWDHFGGDASQLAIAVRDSNRPVAVAPLMIHDRRVSFLGSTDLVDYHDFLTDCDDHEGIAMGVLQELLIVPDWDSVHLESVPDWSPLVESMPAAGKRLGMEFEITVEDVAPQVHMSDTWEEYVSGLGKKDRHELRRKLRRLEAAGKVEHHEFTDPDEIHTRMDDFCTLHRVSTSDKAEFLTADRESFFKDVMVKLAREGKTRLNFTTLDGENVASSISFETGGTRFVYNSGYDPERRDLSVGLANHAFFIQECINDGIEYADFMRGNERYKYNLGGVDRTIYSMKAIRPTA
ncbi:MAG: GNAT family N-acetyltransferase [Chloroflexi bacterium]|nr:GNAT family N-acetyltransferase [Chloroflexota bacterium]